MVKTNIAMQVLKKEINRKILDATKKLVSQKGFRKTSMREIAIVSGVSLGNLYNYYASKDDILKTIVKPVVDIMNNIMESVKTASLAENISDEVGMQQLDLLCASVMKLRRMKQLVKILYYKSDGSEIANYQTDYKENAVKTVKTWRLHRNTLLKDMDDKVLDFIVQMHVNWMMTLLEGLILQDFDEPQIRQLLRDYISVDWMYSQKY